MQLKDDEFLFVGSLEKDGPTRLAVIRRKKKENDFKQVGAPSNMKTRKTGTMSLFHCAVNDDNKNATHAIGHQGKLRICSRTANGLGTAATLVSGNRRLQHIIYQDEASPELPLSEGSGHQTTCEAFWGQTEQTVEPINVHDESLYEIVKVLPEGSFH